MALSGRFDRATKCPLLGVKRTLCGHRRMSAHDPRRTISEQLRRDLGSFSVRQE
jgi:hypothetical protein